MRTDFTHEFPDGRKVHVWASVVPEGHGQYSVRLLDIDGCGIKLSSLTSEEVDKLETLACESYATGLRY